MNVDRLDDAIASSLARAGGKQVLPGMAAILSSLDPQARLRAASYFSEFALFADSRGNISGTQLLGPFANETTKAMRPRRGSNLTTEEYAHFWLNWWGENRKTLGFTEGR
jgi:hypothetical protein